MAIAEVKNPIDTYKNHVREISSKIESGPFKMQYICETLGITRSSLYNKRKNNSFTLKEVEILTDLFEKV